MAGLSARLRLFLLGEAGPRHLPERVGIAIAREQHQGEILIICLQIWAVMTFAVLYWLSPKTFPADAPFRPVPWALGLYALFIAIRLWLILAGWMRDWLVGLAIVVDILVLMVTIWSFHLQYDQPPAFYLKAPTLLYVFILIALRALRFEARWVALSGFVAVAGWSAMVAYAALGDERGMPVTRDYVEYMTSATILLGGEFDKLISIAMVTVILSLALLRGRRLLERSVSGNIVARELSRFVARDVAHQIASADHEVHPGQGEQREAAILFIDLRGFTALARSLGPDRVMGLLGEYQMRVIPVVQRHGGSIDKFMGDGILASFGAARPSATYAADALRAVQDLALELEEWRRARLAAGEPAPEAGFAVSSGPVIFGAVGDASRLEYTVIGDTVNLCAKLEKHNKEEAVSALATRATLELALAQGYRPARTHEIRPERQVAGVGSRVDLCVLLP
ncbi:MAG: adenylate/guanylate cyclase domain-containing protein [Alphaproteobacteria bacterium]|nr:adenylate/guanylate cyclase domain-containing protein [Alphaproteobacteria bacterium]